MKFLRGVIGYGLAGLFVALVWGDFVKDYGIAGGVAACVLIISPLWYINHYLQLVKFDDDSAFIDMGLGVATCAFLKQAFIEKSSESIVNGIPTLVCVIIGSVAGGLVAAKIEKDFLKGKKEDLEIVSIEENNVVEFNLDKETIQEEL